MMPPRPMLLMPLIVACLAACAPTVAETRAAEDRQVREQARIARALAGLTPGESRGCLGDPERRIARLQNIGGTLLFRVGRDRVYRNDMNGNCATNSIDPIFVTQTPTTTLCRGDIAQLIDRASGFPIGACSYGEFVPYTRVK